jgi:DNA-binding transcriptional regulator YiaG
MKKQQNQNMEDFSVKLRDMRTSLNLTQSGADAVLDTCKGQVAAWESGRNTPHVLTQEGALARLRNRKTPRK